MMNERKIISKALCFKKIRTKSRQNKLLKHVIFNENTQQLLSEPSRCAAYNHKDRWSKSNTTCECIIAEEFYSPSNV
jgi:hypothetical protein